MKKPLLFRTTPIIIFLFLFFSACSTDNDSINNVLVSETLSEADKNALLFMLEEEKLARDTYTYLYSEWSINQFDNIKNSEQTHMNAVENLLIQYNIDYNILPHGVFEDETLQSFYNQFVIDGSISQTNALQIGATIEDLDIVDLQDYLDISTNDDLITVFNKLQCGSRNHLRSFVSGIVNGGNIYVPQFLSNDAYNEIIESNQEQCN